MKTVLFQGDSITDVGRSRDNDRMLGSGYPTVAAAIAGSKRPGEFRFLNRGISGSRVVDLYARIRKDMLNLEPDYLSILIGVNDVWHDLENNGVDAVKFEMVYDLLVGELTAARPAIRIMIMEPFVLRGSATNDCYDEFFRPEVLLRAEAAKRVAEKHGLPFLSLQKTFDDLYKEQPEGYWLADGVHPTVEGHGVIARKWLELFEKTV